MAEIATWHHYSASSSSRLLAKHPHLALSYSTNRGLVEQSAEKSQEAGQSSLGICTALSHRTGNSLSPRARLFVLAAHTNRNMDRLLPFNTFSVVVSGTAVMASTLFKHYTQRKKVTKDVEVRNDLMFDEAFSIAKDFFEKASLHTVEETQTFGNNFMPAPFWIRVIRVTVPLDSRLEAGKILIDTIGEEEIQNVIGGSEWWQRTADKSGGVKGEWISMKRDWQGLDAEENDEFDEKRAEKIRAMKEAGKRREKKMWKEGKESEEQWQKEEGKKSKRGKQKDGATPNVEEQPPTDDEQDDDEDYSPEMDEMRCMLYIHGGAYFFGSINTHRYSIWRYARKMGGRAFAIDYRLAPQYPFPCALHDALASYLYLIRPPPGAKHRPVDPAKLTIAGDSAGGGLTLALLCLIRDAGLPAPAGAILISPWCDLTHSFPSILQNTETDIIPPYGFLFKPSTLWPPPPADFQERANSATSMSAMKKAEEARREKKENRHHFMSLGKTSASKKGEDMAKDAKEGGKDIGNDPHDSNPHKAEQAGQNGHKEATAEVAKILRVKIDGEEVEVRDQIQLYATNDQLVHPFVSPAWQPSLGGLPNLYIMCGDREVLRDEIIYMAHRAANPAAYPLRQALLDVNPARTKKHAEYPPTKVHLQVYDDMCHDLPLFSFITPAKYCYRAIASFAKWVTADPKDEVPISPVPARGMSLPVEQNSAHNDSAIHLERLSTPHVSPDSPATTDDSPSLAVPTPSGNVSPAGSIHRTQSGGAKVGRSLSGFLNRSSSPSTSSLKIDPKLKDLEKTIYSSIQPFNRPPYVDNMIRERVSITGVVRPLEPASEIKALHMDPNEIGLVKEGPVRRYLTGKAMWDKRFKRAYEHVQKRREHHLHKSQREEIHRIKKRMKAAAKRKESSSSSNRPPRVSPDGTDDVIQTDSPEPLDVIEGIWELHGERPPPSSIAARKDTYEARQLAHALDEHYSKLHTLHLWTEVQDLKEKLPLHTVRENSDS